MDSTDDIDRKHRTLWVGNLHPKVSNGNVAELFYQVGPIECLEFAYDEHELSENFAWVVFKYPSSVEDSIKLLQGTKLYGLEIITKKYSEQLMDPVFDDQLNYFKQLINVERNNQSNNSNTSRWNDQNLDNQNIIPESLPKPPTHGKYYLNDNYDHRSETVPRINNKDESFKYQHNNSYTKSRDPDCRREYRPVDKFHSSHGHHQKSENNSRSKSMVSSTDRNSYNQDYGSYPSSKWKESNYYNHEQLHSNESLFNKNVLPVRDLRDTIHRKRNILDSDRHRDTNANATCTSVLDLRDTMYRGKNNTFKDVEPSYQPEPKKRWSERKINSRDGSGFSSKPYRKDNDRYNESNSKQTNRYSNQDYNDQSFNNNKSHDNFHKHENPNSFDSYNQERNTPNNFKFNQPRHENLECRGRQQNSYYPYKRSDESHERKEYQNTYFNEQSGHCRGRSSNRGSFDKSRHNYYS